MLFRSIVIFVQLKLGLQIPLLFSWIILYFFCLIKGIDYNALEKHALDAIRSAFVVVLILLSVGTLIRVLDHLRDGSNDYLSWAGLDQPSLLPADNGAHLLHHVPGHGDLLRIGGIRGTRDDGHWHRHGLPPRDDRRRRYLRSALRR